MAVSDVFQKMGDEQFVSLTTFRKTGAPVATAVWVARDADALVVTTGGGSGKIKRLRNDARVELRPCTRMGAVADDAPVAHGLAEVVDDEAGGEQLRQAIAAKYGLQYKAFAGAGRIASVVRSDRAPSVMIRITEPPASGGPTA
ncbi:PPOX class F420-dependent oxidoreductase [uncultured Amnibacterium sp.]|uniref:PPOX class F420-dependent oxidoreductase n=1 Tax=uncultured Amnibacterium sp. TaxID=1631851 RepID=UPI0035CA5002